jgi:hypothetical protein
MSFEGYKRFLAERGIQTVINSSGQFVSTSSTGGSGSAGHASAYGGNSSYAPPVGAAIGVRGPIPRLIVLNVNQ